MNQLELQLLGVLDIWEVTLLIMLKLLHKTISHNFYLNYIKIKEVHKIWKRRLRNLWKVSFKCAHTWVLWNHWLLTVHLKFFIMFYINSLRHCQTIQLQRNHLFNQEDLRRFSKLRQNQETSLSNMSMKLTLFIHYKSFNIILQDMNKLCLTSYKKNDLYLLI